MKIVVSRLEKYPSNEPTSFSVGFIVTLPNGREFYIDTTVPFSAASDDESAVKAAYEKLKEQIESRAQELSAKSPIVGKEFTPTT
jgi:hypothetical protein